MSEATAAGEPVLEPSDDAIETPQDTDGPSAKTPSVRKHGKGFTYMSLKDADDALRKIDHHEKAMTREGFARALGHDAPKGRFIQKLESLKSYALVELDDDMVRLTSLAEDMLYGGSEPSRAKARAQAFLAYEDFKKAFVEVPKNQDHPTQYLLDFVRGKLGIVNEVDRFLRLFLESAEFAGLLDGELNPLAKSIRLRPAVLQGSTTNEPATAGGSQAPDLFAPVPLEEVESVLESFGLASYRDRSELCQRNSGKVELRVADGKIVIEIQRPMRVAIRASDLITDLPAILLSLQQKGFRP